MGFVKVQKNKAYFKRFQVKFRRRREGKTNYHKRKGLIQQDKNKYNNKKYRLVVRISNRDVCCQLISSDLDHDVCHYSAYAHELKPYGLKVGLKNYAACYATGLLLARRVNDDQKIDIEGVEEVDGEYYNAGDDEHDRAPFQAILDVGLARTSTGARVFAALKGAVDGGLNVPHSERRFAGSAKSEEEGEKFSFDAAKHRDYIFGQHVANYMRDLQEDQPKRYERQFSAYIKAGVAADDVEDMYANVHKSVRSNPWLNKKRS